MWGFNTAINCIQVQITDARTCSKIISYIFVLLVHVHHKFSIVKLCQIKSTLQQHVKLSLRWQTEVRLPTESCIIQSYPRILLLMALSKSPIQSQALTNWVCKCGPWSQVITYGWFSVRSHQRAKYPGSLGCNQFLLKWIVRRGFTVALLNGAYRLNEGIALKYFSSYTRVRTRQLELCVKRNVRYIITLLLPFAPTWIRTLTLVKNRREPWGITLLQFASHSLFVTKQKLLTPKKTKTCSVCYTNWC